MLFDDILYSARIFRIGVLGEKLVEIVIILLRYAGDIKRVTSNYVAKGIV